MNKRLAISLRELKRYEEAASAFDEAIAIGLEMTAKDPKAHFPSEGLATSYLQYGIQKDLLGEQEVARELWEKAIAESARFIKPGGDLYLVEVNTHALLRLGRLEEAAPLITQLAEKDFGSNPFKAYARSLGVWPE
jgi:tetratricopeptide (TPR) repeat protein